MINVFIFISENKNLYSWGFNKYGELGIGNNKDQNNPQLIPNFKFISIIAGYQYSIGITGKIFYFYYFYLFIFVK